MKIATFILMSLLISSHVFAQKAAQKVEVLNLDCSVNGRLTAFGFQLNNFDRDIKDSLDIIIGNGLISIRGAESIFNIDAPVTVTNREYLSQNNFISEDNKIRRSSMVSINRNTGALKITIDSIGENSRGVNINAVGNCNKVSDVKKF
jgi:hypothetical protein